MRCCIEQPKRGAGIPARSGGCRTSGNDSRQSFGPRDFGFALCRIIAGRNACTTLLILTLLILVGCTRKPAAGELTLFFTSQTHGRLTHCGCFSGQYGGVARLRTAIESLPGPRPLGVDVGDALEGSEDFHLL